MEDVVERAEKVMKALKNESDGRNSQHQGGANHPVKMITDLAAEVKYLKVKLAYQCGRHKEVANFEREAGLLKEISGIGKDFNKYMSFARYVEALVAYHKYYGGKD